jgi:hypothetical protein
MTTYHEVVDWIAGAAEQFDDPATPVCQLFFRWQDNLRRIEGDHLACGLADGDLALQFVPNFPPLPVPMGLGDYELDANGELLTYGARRITAGVWALSPSLNIEGVIHAFVVLYNVPEPALWDTRIVLGTP